MNNFNLMRAAGWRIELKCADGWFYAVAFPDEQGPARAWAKRARPAWANATVTASLFSQLPESTREAVAIFIAKHPAAELEWLGRSAIPDMLKELKSTPQGSPLDRALLVMIEGAAPHFKSIAAALHSRAGAAITPQLGAAPNRQAGRF